ncbi:hypothetical protein DFJ74DRAFT_710764 [Hyaloraphidium curvatum]|nr:hypothetical protein DFJ74DRAFT_710764 [Hyaloraphidium curvatum]
MAAALSRAALLLALVIAACPAPAVAAEGRGRANGLVAKPGQTSGLVCVATTLAAQAVSPATLLPNRIVNNRDRSIAPEWYFALGPDSGKGKFGSVRVAALRASVRGPLDPADSPGRVFAIRSLSQALSAPQPRYITSRHIH